MTMPYSGHGWRWLCQYSGQGWRWLCQYSGQGWPLYGIVIANTTLLSPRQRSCEGI
jgi:hypothetical protein